MTRWLPRIVLVLALVVCARPAVAQVAFDAANNSSCVSGVCTGTNNTLTYALTVAANTNRALAVIVSLGCSSGETAVLVSTVTYAGVGLTQIKHQNSVAAAYIDLWALPAGTQPATGANNVVVTLASALGVGCIATAALSSGAISAFNVNQTTTFSSTNGASGTSATASVTISTSGANDLGIHGACAGSALSAPTGTSRWNTGNTNTSCNEYGGATAAGGTTTMQWTVGASDTWNMVAGAFKTLGGATPCNRTLLGVGC